jgi:hypothetical protein
MRLLVVAHACSSPLLPPPPCRTVRDKLSRLSQMALLLGLESVEEVLDYWAAPGAAGGPAASAGGEAGGGITWRLSAAEVRAALLQRSDFNRELVMALPLH